VCEGLRKNSQLEYLYKV